MHDSLLVAYSVDSISERLTLSLQPHHGSAPGPFRIEFSGVAAHRFDAPLLPAIVSDIEKITGAKLLRDEWAQIESRSRVNGWPGGWAGTLEAAIEHTERTALHGYLIDSSYGLNGWVLARTVEIRMDEIVR
ncbi:hypothetical protein [Lysobacter sp. Root690]|uniref:hypothetical protein n=1 Tax=Lysobacter sp. Root690 TaxID=1736588 RepID=UPI0006FA6D53|nr:hypothetical protein [Lysobacter sp. Root690]KRB02585.1 hypothetical protein ASD86_24075 [Lysobacter sp. Root690]